MSFLSANILALGRRLGFWNRWLCGCLLFAYACMVNIPLSASFSDCDYRDRRTDIGFLFFLGSINLKLYQSINKADMVATEFRTPSTGGCGRIHSEVSTEEDWPRFPRNSPHRGFDRFDYLALGINSKLNGGNDWRAFFKTGERELDYRRALEPSFIGFLIIGLADLYNGRKSTKNCGLYDGINSFDVTRATYCIKSKRPNIELDLRNSVSSSSSIETRLFLPNFANRPKALCTAFRGHLDAISADDDCRARDEDSHSRSVSTVSQKREDSCKPRYLRRNDEGAYFGELDLTTGEQVEIITGHDLDVSCDGKRWFHLLGSYCLKREKPFYSH